jgi:succinylglutamate desuccinylase
VDTAFPTDISVSKVCDHGFLFTPKVMSSKLPNGREIGLTLVGLTHGNEVAGLALVNEVVRSLREGLIKLDFPLALILGNPPAALKNQRFLEKDLNRCFMNSKNEKWEEQRARAIEQVLRRSAFLIDFHQTSQPSSTPFFIFPYSAQGFLLAKEIEPDLPVVTHWGTVFSEEGGCTDEFINSQGGTGITIELGQNSFHPYHVAAGYKVALKGIMTVSRYFKEGALPRFSDEGEIFSWGEVIKLPDHAYLHPGWFNFKDVAKGDELGRLDDKPIVASVSGKILFPKYGGSKPEGKTIEICRILKRVAFGEIKP